MNKNNNNTNDANLNNFSEKPEFAVPEYPQHILENNANKAVIEINEGVCFQDNEKANNFYSENYNIHYIYSNNDNDNNFKENLIIPKFPNENSQIYVKPRENKKKCRFYTSMLIIIILIILGLLYLYFFTSFFRLKVVFFIETYLTTIVKQENNRIFETLSKLEVNCPEGQVLTSFTLKSIPSYQYYYYYTCGRSPFNFFDDLVEKQSITKHYDENFEDEIDVLSKIEINCLNNSAINRFKLNYDKNRKNIFYSYSCLEFESKARFLLKCNNRKSEYSYSYDSDKSLNNLVDIKSGEEMDSTRFLNSFKIEFENGLFETKAYFYSMKTCKIYK